MKAVVFHDVGDIRLETVKDPVIKDATDAVIRITASAICGTDLHFVRGTMPGMKPGTILGHEAVGVVEEVGESIRNLRPGDRVVVPSTIACGYCSYCRAGYQSQCDTANPNGREAGTVFYGGPAPSGPVHGLQAEYARIPFANVGLVKLPDDVTDDQAILLSDIFPTGYFGAHMAEIDDGDTVAVFGCGPVGLFAIESARLMGADRILAVDTIASRLDMARNLGAEVIDYNAEDPVEMIKGLTGGIGVDRAIDAVGVDAAPAVSGPAAKESKALRSEFQQEMKRIAPKIDPHDGNWHPGGAPFQVLLWAVGALAKAGTLSVIGVYPQTASVFPIGMFMNRNLTMKGGNCNHRRYIPHLLELIRSGASDPTAILTTHEPLKDVIDAYKAFDRRLPGWIKVELVPEQQAA